MGDGRKGGSNKDMYSMAYVQCVDDAALIESMEIGSVPGPRRNILACEATIKQISQVVNKQSAC